MLPVKIALVISIAPIIIFGPVPKVAINNIGKIEAILLFCLMNTPIKRYIAMLIIPILMCPIENGLLSLIVIQKKLKTSVIVDNTDKPKITDE